MEEIKNLFTSHPKKRGMSYLKHMKFALINSLLLFAAGLSLIVHSVLPFIMKSTASNIVESLNKKFKKN